MIFRNFFEHAFHGDDSLCIMDIIEFPGSFKEWDSALFAKFSRTL